MAGLSNNFKQKFQQVSNYLGMSYYYNLSEEVVDVGGIETTTPVLLGLLTCLLEGTVMYTGIPGTGKTSLSEALVAISTGTPIDKLPILIGTVGTTFETALGHPNLYKLNNPEVDEPKVTWLPFTGAPGKIVDEANRLSPTMQATLLELLANKRLRYMGEVYDAHDGAFFLTRNYEDEANFPIINPLLDRILVSTECLPGALGGKQYAVSKAKEKLTSAGWDKSLIFTPKEKSEFKESIGSIEPNVQASFFIDFMTTELGYDPLCGVKRPGEGSVKSNHYKNTFSGIIKENIAGRFCANGALDYAKAVAALKGQKELTPSEIFWLLEYTLVHRVSYYPEELLKADKLRQDDFYKAPCNQYLTRMQLKTSYNHFMEQFPTIRDLNKHLVRYSESVNSGKIDQSHLDIAKKILESKKNTHPYYDFMYAMTHRQVRKI